jgi:hypothetical protein
MEDISMLEQALDSITNSILEIKQHYGQPNLFTVLLVKDSKSDEILITANDLIDLVQQIVNTKLELLDRKGFRLSGEGTEINPHRLSTSDEWLWAAKKFKIEEEKPVFFEIGKHIIDVTSDERKVSATIGAHESNFNDRYFFDTSGIFAQSIQNLINPSNIQRLREQTSVIGLLSAPTNDSLKFIISFVCYLVQSVTAKYNPEGEFKCDLIRMSSTPILNLLNELPIHSNSAYVRVNNQLFYINKRRSTCNEVKDDKSNSNMLQNFDMEMKTHELGFGVPRTLSDDELKRIAFITSYVPKSWDKPPYSKLAMEHDRLENYIKEKLSTLTSDNLDKAITEAFTTVISSQELNGLNFVEHIGQIFQVFDSALKRSNAPQELLVKLEQRKNLFLDTRVPLLLSVLPKEQSNFTLSSLFCPLLSIFSTLPANYQRLDFEASETGSQTSNDKIEQSDIEHDLPFNENHPLVTVLKQAILENVADNQHLVHIQALNHVAQVNEIRSILADQVTVPDNYLPVTVAALFFSETSRYPVCYIASLALLDLIEAKQNCPDVEECYNFFNMLKNPVNRHAFVDAYGRLYSDDEKNDKDKFKERFYRTLSEKFSYSQDKIESVKKNKIQKVNERINTIVLGKTSQNVAGYHPMVQGNSFKEVSKIEIKEESKQLNLVQQKIASILIQWLAFQLHPKGINAEPRRVFLNDLARNKLEINGIKRELLDLHIKPLLEKRIQTFTFMHSDINNDLIQATATQTTSISLSEQQLDEILEQTWQELFGAKAFEIKDKTATTNDLQPLKPVVNQNEDNKHSINAHKLEYPYKFFKSPFSPFTNAKFRAVLMRELMDEDVSIIGYLCRLSITRKGEVLSFCQQTLPQNEAKSFYKKLGYWLRDNFGKDVIRDFDAKKVGLILVMASSQEAKDLKRFLKDTIELFLSENPNSDHLIS